MCLFKIARTESSAMFDSPKSESTTLFCERVVLADRVVPASIRIENGVIAEIAEGDRKGTELDDQVLIPGIVDVHTDHVETHVFPRSTVRWAFLPSLMAHDGVAVSGGTTTVFDSLCVGSSVKRPERVEILGPLIDAMEEGRARGAFRADHLLHLRCEISDTETMDLVDQNIGRDITRLVSVMDHTPGDRQSPDVDRWMRHMIQELGIGEEEGRARLEELLERSARVGADVRAHVVAA
ncbi:MAG: alpha-D-ribose 1-methylphosphonate 5-triphosphate diphosphatase, partial [Pseudomonadota bacterium]